MSVELIPQLPAPFRLQLHRNQKQYKPTPPAYPQRGTEGAKQGECTEMNDLSVQISEYDQWTINYVSGLGAGDALVERVTRLAEEVAYWRARAEAAENATVKAGA